MGKGSRRASFVGRFVGGSIAIGGSIVAICGRNYFVRHWMKAVAS